MMRHGLIRSFRVRLMLLSTLLAGCVLIAFAAWAYTRVHRMGLDRIDEQIRATGQRQLSVPPHERGHWANMSEALEFVFGDVEGEAFILLVKDFHGDIIHQSANWPDALDPESFPIPEGPREDWRAPRARGERGFGPPPRPRPGGPPRDDAVDRDQRPHERFGPPPPRPPDDERRDDRPGMSPREFRRADGPGPPPPPLRVPTLSTLRDEDRRWRIGVMGSPHMTMVLGINMAGFDADMARARTTFLAGAAAALGLLVLGSGYLARRALVPVNLVTRTAENVTAQGLNQRISVEQADSEFAQLIGVFNDMMARLERSFNQAVRFSADAAHELKTPLTILQGELEAGVQDSPAGSDAQRRHTRLLEEVQRLKAITRKLLLLSLADAGRLTMNRTPVNLSDVVQASIEDVRILAPGLRVEEMVEPGVIVSADADLFRQVIQNLANNAAKYTNEGGNVQFRLARQGANVIFEVANTGQGIPAEDREKVFDRFYRADKARGRVVEGIGLGLSLAREIARAHGGELTLIDSRDGMTVFHLTLPGGSD